MRRFNQKGFGVVTIGIIFLVIGLIGTSTYLVYQRQQDKDEQAKLQQQIDELREQDEAETVEESQAEEATLTEDEQILEAAGCDNSANCEIERAENRGIGGDQDLAKVSVSDGRGPGYVVLLSKENGAWQVLYEGNGDVPQDVLREYDFPAGWTGPAFEGQ